MALLDNVLLFQDISPSDRETLSQFCQERVIKAWEVLFEKNQESNSMYIVMEWVLQAYDLDRVLWEIYPQEIVGEMALFLPSKKRTASVKALQDTKLVVFLDVNFVLLSQKYPDIITSLKNIIENRVKINKLLT